MAFWKLLCPSCDKQVTRTNDPGNLPNTSSCPYCRASFDTKEHLQQDTNAAA